MFAMPGPSAYSEALGCNALACRYIWNNIGGGGDVWRLTGHVRFPSQPDKTQALWTGNFEVPRQVRALTAHRPL